jgi:hypothetical protein
MPPRHPAGDVEGVGGCACRLMEHFDAIVVGAGTRHRRRLPPARRPDRTYTVLRRARRHRRCAPVQHPGCAPTATAHPSDTVQAADGREVDRPWALDHGLSARDRGPVRHRSASASTTSCAVPTVEQRRTGAGRSPCIVPATP